MRAEQTTAEPTATTARQDHLAEASEGRWGIWKWICLRAAGFPVTGVESLSASRAAEAADELMQAEDRAEGLWQEAVEQMREELKAAGDEKKSALSKALKRLKKGQVPEALPPGCSAEEVVKAFAEAYQRVDLAYKQFNEAFESSSLKVSESLSQLARSSKFREAIIWQNRRALHTAISLLEEGPPEQPSKKNQHRRRSEELAAIYLQRYCTKNDTIGFFGPVGWARIVDEGRLLGVAAGANLVAERNVYFDAWAIDAVAEALGKDEAIRPWLAPRRVPSIFVEGNSVYIPFKGFVTITPPEAALLNLCDGQLSAKQIVESLIDSPMASGCDEAGLYRLLEGLRSGGLIRWELEVPWNAQRPFDWHVENNLRRILERIGDTELRQQALAKLARLESARDQVSRAAGDADKLDQAFDNLESEFTSITGMAATRAEGRMYAGRTILYEDCRRDADVEVGAELFKHVESPLSLILASARWYIGQIAEACLESFEEIYDDQARQSASSAVSFQEFWARAQPLIFGDKKGLIADCLHKLQDRWMQILSFDPQAARASYDSEQLRGRVLAAFPEPERIWSYARYNSPDLMISAPSLEAILRGDFHFVMGEFHVGTNTLNGMFFAAQHPSPQDLFDYFERDISEPLIIPVAPKFMITQRTYSVFESEKDLRLDFSNDPSGVPAHRVVPIGSLIIEREGDGLAVKSRDGKHRFDLLEPFGDMLSEKIANHFKLLPPLDHTPRIAIDRLVIARESWRLSATDMEFAFEKEPGQRFIAARRWAHLNGLPRYVYFKSPIEVKPCFLDFTSPILIDIFSKIVRRTVENLPAAKDKAREQMITITEMLPTPDRVWLPDREGNRYTSELRMVTVFAPQ